MGPAPLLAVRSRADGGSTVNWRQPAVFASPDETPVTPPVRPPVVPPPYSRTQDNKNSRQQETATHARERETASPMISPESETSTPDDRPPVDGRTYEKLEDVPRSDQARILTSRLPYTPYCCTPWRQASFVWRIFRRDRAAMDWRAGHRIGDPHRVGPPF
jgi:hypothetical protein